jgi:hypothetical protein
MAVVAEGGDYFWKVRQAVSVLELSRLSVTCLSFSRQQSREFLKDTTADITFQVTLWVTK